MTGCMLACPLRALSPVDSRNTAVSDPIDPLPPAGTDTVTTEPFVAWLRTVAPYIHAFRGKTFVVGAPGELFASGRLNALVQDLGLLHAMGMRIVLVHGSRPQVTEQLRLRGVLDGDLESRLNVPRRPQANCAWTSKPPSRKGCRIRRWRTRPSGWCRATS